MNKNKHIIEKVFLEIDTNSMNVANRLKNNTTMFVENELLALIEQELNRFSIPEDVVLQIDTLTLTIGNNSLDSNSISNPTLLSNEIYKREIENQIRQKIEAILQQTKKNDFFQSKDNNKGLINTSILSLSDKKSNTLLYYLQYGKLPWWCVQEVQNKEQKTAVFHEENIQEMIKNKAFTTKFKAIIIQKKVQQRIIYQFTNKQISLLITLFNNSKHLDYYEITRENGVLNIVFTHANFALKKSFWEALFTYFVEQKLDKIYSFYLTNETLFKSKKWSFTHYIKELEKIISFSPSETKNLLKIAEEINLFEKKTGINKKEENQLQKEENNTLHEKEFYTETLYGDENSYIQNAGLILLHPFIKEFFKNCQLLEENNKTINDKELAVHLLHYLATEEENDYEYNMLFEKFLCGLTMDFPIKREVVIPLQIKEEAEKMLASVLSHWTALKSSSVAILRNEFLQREGKIDFKDGNPKIFIERKTQDILLERLPWNISIIKIPWLEKLIYTEW
ncbi:contractile injection system tape measure protein [Flavobacterium sp. J27]|uniref:contractile injection system tape measure protein n=1 Tax=Flavobacterium sp. J27 TaxID=2060419 RepID=UPI001030EA40|nr:contractile injection system tape measure protein [Flavobacterium sp. J27]